MALDDKSFLNNKLSPLIEGQVPDFVQSDHPLFVNFLKDYYKFLEAGQLKISTTTDYIALETTSSSYILNEEDSDRIVTELGAGTTGYFVVGETITGQTSAATAEVLVDDSRNARIFITSQQKFITGEVIKGGTSNSEGIITEYRANPVQNIQQMLDYADVDNTIYDFLDKMKNSLMVNIPNDLASGVSSRNLLKNIKDLYSAKGTSEGHKLFMKILLGESAEIFYPNQYMIKPSAAQFETITTLSVTAFNNSSSEEIINQKITGETSGATAIVVGSLTTQQSNTIGSVEFNDSVTELEISNIVGTFLEDEIVSGTSTVNDNEAKFTVKGILSTVTIVNDGLLYEVGETIDIEAVGNGVAQIQVDKVKSGSVSDIHIETKGTGYSVGDKLTFTSDSADTNIKSATGEVVMIGGGIQLESGTLDDSTITDDTIILEDSTTSSLVSFNIQLEEVLEDILIGDGTTKEFTLTNTNGTNDTLSVYLDSNQILANYTSTNNASYRLNESGVIEEYKADVITTNWTASSNTITFTFAPSLDTVIKIIAGQNDSLLLDRTDLVGVSGSGSSATGGANSGFKIESDSTRIKSDTYNFLSNNIVLEEATFSDLSVASEAGQIQKAVLNRKGIGYTKLPSITVSSVGGSGAKLLALTETIGAVSEVKIVNSGFRYLSTNPPDVSFRAHFILKDVTGTFAKDNTLTTHTGTVVDWDSTRNILTTTFENVRRITQEQETEGSFDGILLESTEPDQSSQGFLLETEQIVTPTGFDVFHAPADEPIVLRSVEEDRIVFDATDIIDPYNPDPLDFSNRGAFGFSSVFGNNAAAWQFADAQFTPNEYIKVSAKYDTDEETWAFYLDGEKQRELIIYEGVKYIFDLSDGSLFGNKTGTASELEKNFSLSTTSDGTHNSGTIFTDGFVTTSVAAIRIGTAKKPDIDLKQIKLDSNEYEQRVAELTEGTLFTPDELEAIQRGYVQAYLKLFIPLNSTREGTYYYFSPNFSGMGGKLQIRKKPKYAIGQGTAILTEREAVQETAFLLEAGSQDRDVGHTDKLLMEDSFNDWCGTTGQTAAFTNFLGVVDQATINIINQNYEPTFFMNEDYKPLRRFHPRFTRDERDTGIFNIPPQLQSYPRTSRRSTVTEKPSGFVEGVKLIPHPDADAEDNFFPPLISVPITPAFPKDEIISDFGRVRKGKFRPAASSTGYILANEIRSIEDNGFIILDGTDASGTDAGERILPEDINGTIVLDGTDGSSTDAGSRILTQDSVGDGTILINSSDSSSTDAGDDIIFEDSIDFSNSNVTITDSSGATGKILSSSADIATATTTVNSTTESVGSYRGINNLLGQDLVRIQDSLYYQDYSYEVRVGQSLVTYIDELKKAVHPAGFQPFGKVSIATLVSAAITNTAAGVSDYTGDTTTFSPELASVLETIFSQVLQSRAQAPKTVVGQLVIQNGIELEDSEAGHEQSSIVLDGTDSSGSNSGDELKLEAFFDNEATPVAGTVSIGSIDDKIVQETGVLPGDNLVLDASATDTDVGANLIFEDENLELELGSGNIVLNGTDSDSLNAGDNIRINLGTGFDLESGLAVFGDSFLYETFSVTSGDLNTSGVGDGGGRIMAETSHAPSENSDKVVVSEKVMKLKSRPLPKFERNILLYLAETPFGNEPCGITLEAGSGNLTDSIVMDGQLPFNEGSAFMELERDSEIDNIILDGTDALGTDAGDGLVLETGFFLKIEDPSLGRESETFNIKFEDDGKLQLEASIYAFPIGFHVSDGDRLLFDTLDNDETISLSDISSLTFQDIRTVDKFEIQGLSTNEENWGGGADDDNITLEDSGQLVFDATSSKGTRLKKFDDGTFIANEILKASIGLDGESGIAQLFKTEVIDGRILGDISGNGSFSVRDSLSMAKFETQATMDADEKTYIENVLLPTILSARTASGDAKFAGFLDEFSDDRNIGDSAPHPFGGLDTVISPFEGENDFLLAEETTELNKFTLEESGNLVVERYSTLSNISKMNVEDSIDGGSGNIIQESSGDEILLEQHTLLANRGQIPAANFRLNSTSIITKGNVRSADVSVRDTGDIALEDATDDTHGYLVINSTSGSSTNAGENFDLEGATGITY